MPAHLSGRNSAEGSGPKPRTNSSSTSGALATWAPAASSSHSASSGPSRKGAAMMIAAAVVSGRLSKASLKAVELVVVTAIPARLSGRSWRAPAGSGWLNSNPINVKAVTVIQTLSLLPALYRCCHDRRVGSRIGCVVFETRVVSSAGADRATVQGSKPFRTPDGSALRLVRAMLIA